MGQEQPIEQPVEEVQETAETQETIEEVTEEATPSTEEEPEKKKSGVEKRIGKLTKDIYELKGQNKAYEQLLAQNTQKPKEETKQEQPVLEPKFDDFETTEDYTKALVSFQSQEIRKTIQQETLQTRQNEQAKKRQDTLLRAQDETVKKGFEKFKDNAEEFEEAKNTVILPRADDPKFGLIIESPNSHDIIMHLHRNEDIANKLVNMSTLDAAKLIGAIESKLSVATKPKKISKAPTPITPVGDNYQIDRPVSEMSQKEFEKAWESGKIR